MKVIALLFCAFSAVSAYALDGCPDLTGTYTTQGDTIRFEQTDCEQLTRYSASRYTDTGTVFKVIRRFKLDGTPFLYDGKRGETAKLVGDTYEFGFNFAGGHRFTYVHGFCEVPKMVVSKHEDGRKLKVTYQAENCEDGFSGEETSTWTRYSN